MARRTHIDKSQARKRVIQKVRCYRFQRHRPVLPIGVREILQRIIGEMDGCKDQFGKPCNSHSVTFGADDLIIAKAALAAPTPKETG